MRTGLFLSRLTQIKLVEGKQDMWDFSTNKIGVRGSWICIYGKPIIYCSYSFDRRSLSRSPAAVYISEINVLVAGCLGWVQFKLFRNKRGHRKVRC